MLLMIDNFDSFTFNLVHYFSELGAEVVVKRNNEISIAEIEALAPTHIVISPGPCTPNESGISLDVIKYFSHKLPILGVCLGHQSIVQVFGGDVIKANAPMHGKTSMVQHKGEGLFEGLPEQINVARYHSLIAKASTLPDCFDVVAWTTDDARQVDEIMAIQHHHLPIYGIQFHPEAILTEFGHELLKNFLCIAEE